MTDIGKEMRDARKSLSLLHLKQLEQLGMNWADVCNLTHDGAVGFAKVTAAEDETYYPDPNGIPHLVLEVVEDGGVVDLLAFRSGDPERWLLRNGLGSVLGLGGGLEGLTWLLPGEVVKLHKTPLDWLRAGSTGVCIVDWSAPDLHRLCGVPHLHCDDAALANRLKAALTRPSYLPTISVQQEARLAA